MSYIRITRKIFNGKIVSELVEKIEGEPSKKKEKEGWEAFNKSFEKMDEAFTCMKKSFKKLFKE